MEKEILQETPNLSQILLEIESLRKKTSIDIIQTQITQKELQNLQDYKRVMIQVKLRQFSKKMLEKTHEIFISKKTVLLILPNPIIKYLEKNNKPLYDKFIDKKIKKGKKMTILPFLNKFSQIKFINNSNHFIRIVFVCGTEVDLFFQSRDEFEDCYDILKEQCICYDSRYDFWGFRKIREYDGEFTTYQIRSKKDNSKYFALKRSRKNISSEKLKKLAKFILTLKGLEKDGSQLISPLKHIYDNEIEIFLIFKHPNEAQNLFRIFETCEIKNEKKIEFLKLIENILNLLIFLYKKRLYCPFLSTYGILYLKKQSGRSIIIIEGHLLRFCELSQNENLEENFITKIYKKIFKEMIQLK